MKKDDKDSVAVEQLSDEFRKTFGLAKPEGVIQNYGCCYGGITTPGTLYISQNYVCFQGGKEPVKIPYAKITDVTLEGSAAFRSIEIKTENSGNHSFGWFKWVKHCRHAFNLICHIWKNPPHYIDVQAYREAAASIDRAQEEAAKKRDQTQQVKNKLNVNLAKDVLNTVNETEAMQKETMKMLAEQGELLDRVEDKLNDIHDNLKRADHLMKGIESMSYYMFGGSTKKEVNEKREKQKKDRTIKIPEGTPPIIEIDGLFKNGDNLEPCTIVFNAENFQIINPKTDKPFSPQSQYSYYDVEIISVKTRNEYFQISFNTKQAPILLCSAYRQIITNQLYTRAKKSGYDITVEFQHGSNKYEYQDEWIYKIPPEKRGAGQGKAGNQAFSKLSSLFTDEQTKKDAQEIDDTLDQVSNVVGNIIVAGKATNVVIKQQTEQIKNLETMTDSATDKMKSLGERMDKQG